MDEAAATGRHHGYPLWAKVLMGVILVAVILALLLARFPWDRLREPLNRYVSEKTGRHFEITRKLDIKLGWKIRILVASDASSCRSSNCTSLNWACNWKPTAGAVGRSAATRRTRAVLPGSARSWLTRAPCISSPPTMAQTASAPANAMPLTFKSKGVWQKESFAAQGRVGNVLYLSGPLRHPFPIEVEAAAAGTTLRANGSIANLATLEGAEAVFNLQGHNLADLYKLVGLVMPETPRYALRGTLSKQANVWHVRQIEGKLGNSDGKVALLMGSGQISNLLLEFAGIDDGEIVKFLLKGDKNVLLRCVAAAFDVNHGLMSSQALLLDTSDTVAYGSGQVNLANETMDLSLHPSVPEGHHG